MTIVDVDSGAHDDVYFLEDCVTDEWLYLAEAGDTGYFKVGWSRNPVERMRRLQGVSPFPLRLCAVLPGGCAEEARTHRNLAQWRDHGEWFRLETAREALEGDLRRPTSWLDFLILYSEWDGVFDVDRRCWTLGLAA